MSAVQDSNYEQFRESLSSQVVASLTEPVRVKRKGKSRKSTSQQDESSQESAVGDADDFADFVEFLASEIFGSLADDLQTLDYVATRNDLDLAAKYELPLAHERIEDVVSTLPPVASDSLVTYGLVQSPDAMTHFIGPVLSSYIGSVTQPPSSAMTTVRAANCEICERDWVPLSYHHLIPKDVHDKVLKRGWHAEWELSNVAWLCRQCHSMVHRIATTEELARHYYTVELLLERADVQSWSKWISRVRWKSR